MTSQDAGKTTAVTGAGDHYGTFQGVATDKLYTDPPPPLHQPVTGFPQPMPPPSTADGLNYHNQPVGHEDAEGRPVREHRLPCFGIGVGWFLFIVGFFFAAFPWYIGAIIVLFVRVDHREKPGYVACTIAAILAVIATALGVVKATLAW